MARASGREVPVGCLVDAHRGLVPVARVDAGGVGAGLVGVMGGCAGKSCLRSVRPSWCMASRTAMSVAVGGSVRSSSVGAAFRSPMMMVPYVLIWIRYP